MSLEKVYMNLMNSGIWSAYTGIPIIVVPDSKRQNRTHKKKRINKKWLRDMDIQHITILKMKKLLR